MGKIMMNGVQYGVGGIEQAKDISYDNTESGATATDVQGALDELNNGLISVFSGTQSFSAINAQSESRAAVTFPKRLSSGDYAISLTLNAGGAYWAAIRLQTTNRSPTGFTIVARNDTGDGVASDAFSVMWTVVVLKSQVVG